MYKVGFLGRRDFTAEAPRRRVKRNLELTKRGLEPRWGRLRVGFVREKLRVVWLPKPATRWVPQWSCSLARNVVAKSPRKFGLFHKSARRFTKVRTDQARKSSIVRIVTGKAYFFKKARKSGSER